MGEKSRRKQEPREVKDPLRFQRANIAAFTQREEQLAAAYHSVKTAREEAQKRFDEASLKLAENGHPLYAPKPYVAPDAPETAPAATDNGGEVASDGTDAEGAV